MSLRTFHLFFILTAIVVADLFGAWTIWYYPQLQDNLILALGIVTILASFALMVYAVKLVRRLDEADIH